MAPFTLTCLGTPEVRGPDGDLLRFRTRKHLALLVVLAVEPSVAHRRDRLATLLWPGSDSDEARHSLAVALSVIRSRLGADALDTGRDSVRLVAGRVATDLAAVEHVDPADPAAPPIAPFLDEFEIPDAPDFQQWKDGQQASCVALLHGVLARRIDHARRSGDSRRLEDLGRQLRRVDPLTEEGIRAVVEARAMAGDRIGAIREYDRWQARLADELGATPSAALARMGDRLRRRGIDRPAAGTLAPVPTEQWKERSFIGRADAFRRCYDVWQVAREGTPRHVLVRGESGIGKTTLVERFVTAVALEGASVARLQCYALERELPFGAAGGLVSMLLDLPGAGATAPEHLAELSRIVAKVRQRFPSLPTPLPSVGEGARIRFTEAVMALIAAVADEQPAVLVVDDMPLADATSLAVLHLILRRVRELPLMLLLTSSSTLDAELEGARRFVDNAESIGLVHLALDPMTETECRALLDALLGAAGEPGPTIRRAILAAARGNPMVLELLVADWRRRGDDCLALSLGAMTARAERPPVEAFHHLVERSLASLDAEARAVAQLGAMLGKRMNDLSMYTLVDLSVTRTMRAMTALTAQRVLRDAGNQLEFASEFTRGQCYVGMAAPLRRMLHALVADRLLLHDGGDEPIPGLEIAWHLVRADRLAEAIPYLLAGGRESIRRGAPHEADLALSTGMPALTGDARRAAILLLAEAQQELGRWQESLRVLDSGEGFTESEECCRTVLRIVARRWLGGMNKEVLEHSTQELCTIARSQVDIDARVKALAALPYLLTQSRCVQTTAALGDIIEAVSLESMDSYQRLHVLLAAAWRADQLRLQPLAQQLICEAISLIDATGAASTVAVRIYVGAGLLNIEAGDYEAARPLLERAVLLATRLDNDLQLAAAAAGLAIAEGRLGRTGEQLRWSRTGLRCIPKDDAGIVTLCVAYERGLALCLEGRTQEAVAGIYEIDARFASTAMPWAVQAWHLIRADIFMLAGDERRALASGKKATNGHNSRLLLNDFAGPFARWTALTRVRTKNIEGGLSSLQFLLNKLQEYHLKDQAEVLASVALLEASDGVSATKRWEDVQSRLARLPFTVTAMLSKLGVLPTDWAHTGSGRIS